MFALIYATYRLTCLDLWIGRVGEDETHAQIFRSRLSQQLNNQTKQHNTAQHKTKIKRANRRRSISLSISVSTWDSFSISVSVSVSGYGSDSGSFKGNASCR